MRSYLDHRPQSNEAASRAEKDDEYGVDADDCTQRCMFRDHDR